ncbi:hypothetical protein DVA69_12685 [Acinetobacter baumannii]|nr:hypothetical protein DVA69_12685 [Acinetobacter baumannii]
MTDLNKEREADTLPEVAHLLEQCNHRDLTLIERAFVKGARYAWQEKAKAQAVPDTHIHSVTLTCAELKEAFDFGAPDGEKDQFQMETEMSIKWLDDGYDGAGYYCWYADLPEEGCIKLGESESGAEG